MQELRKLVDAKRNESLSVNFVSTATQLQCCLLAGTRMHAHLSEDFISSLVTRKVPKVFSISGGVDKSYNTPTLTWS